MLFPPPPHSDSDANIMFLAVISLLLVILFVLLLHLYARWFLFQASQRTTVTLPLPLGSRLHHRYATTTTTTSSARSTGLPSSIITSLPLFIHKPSSPLNSNFVSSECAICLSGFQEAEIGRQLPGCGHVFHVDCIDMWLHSHSTCPICRAAILYNYHNRKTANRMIDHIEIMDHPVDHDGELRLEMDRNVVRDEVEESPECTNAVLKIECGSVGGSSSSGSLEAATMSVDLERKENGEP